jgi:hypothetical protein
VPGSNLGALFIANGSGGGSTTELESAATSANVIKFPATVLGNGDLMYCVVFGSGCTLTDTLYAYNAIPGADISGAVVSATTATNLAGTTQYSVPYQSASATTSYVAPQTIEGDYIYMEKVPGGSAVAPVWQNVSYLFADVNGTTCTIGSTYTGSSNCNPAVGGDVTGTQSATTVGKINGTSMAGLASGILYNTTSTGVPSIATQAQFTAAMNSQYKTWSALDGLVSTAALGITATPSVVFGVNGTGATETITTITCFVDTGTGSTFTLVDNSGNNVLGASGTCSTSGTSIAVSGTHYTISSAGYLKYVITPDSTAKAVTLAVSGTY